MKKTMSIFVSIGSHMYNPWRVPRICSMKWTSCTNMTLRTQVKDAKMQMLENVQCYFTMRSQLKEKLEAIGDNVKEAEAYITNLNGLPSSVKGVVLEGRSPIKECT